MSVTAAIILQQNSDGYNVSISRDDLVLGSFVTMLNADDTSVVSWAWTLIDRPTGSTATIVDPIASSTTFMPDIVGTYLIRLSVNSGAARDQKGAAIKTANFHYRIPAATETIEFDGYRGWGTATNKALQAIDDGYMSHVPFTFQDIYNASSPSSFFINTTNGGIQIHDASTPTGANLFEIDAYGGGSKFFTVAVASTSINNNLLVINTNRVGVNTPTPLYPIHITTSTDNYSFIHTRSTVTGGLYARVATTAGLGLGTFSNHSLFFFTNNTPGTPSMILTTGGAIGLGTISPSHQLDVVGTGHFTGAIALDGGFISSAESSMSSFKITSLATPTTGTDAANKTYVDTSISDLTLQSTYTTSTPATVLLNMANNAIIIQDAYGHIGSGQTPLFKIDAYNSASNYLTIYRAGEELNREAGSTIFQTTGGGVTVIGYKQIWGSGSNDIYAVGVDSGIDNQQIAHFDGAGWTTLSTYPGAVGDEVNTVYGFGASSVYIGVSASGGGPGGIWHTINNGISWTQQYSTKGVNSIWGADATHIYAIVQDNSGIILSSNGGGSWTPTAGNIGANFANSVWGVNSNEFWIAATNAIYYTTNAGASFTSQFDTNSNSTGFISIGFSVNWRNIWGTSHSNVYAVGRFSDKGFIAHYNGTFWSLQIQNYSDPIIDADGVFSGVFGTTANDIYAVGGQTILYSNGNGAWIPQIVDTNILGGGTKVFSAWASTYNQWYISTGNVTPAGVIAFGPQGANITAAGIATLSTVVTNNIMTQDIGVNQGNTLKFSAFIDSDNANGDIGFIFNTTSPIYTGSSSNFLAIFQSGSNDIFKIKGDGYLFVPDTGGFRQFNDTDIFGWTPSQIIFSESLQINNTLLSAGLGTFQSHINVDGYTIDISDGVTTGQALVYNGSAFIAQDDNNLLSGSGAPNNANGKDGDFYLDTAANILYGPKASGVWPGPGLLLGGGFNPTGTWVMGNSYVIDDIVIHFGSTFRCKLAISPSNTSPEGDATHFEIWAAKGDDGASGSPGASLGNDLQFRHLGPINDGIVLDSVDMHVLCDVFGGSFTVFLPATPNIGETKFIHVSNADPLSSKAVTLDGYGNNFSAGSSSIYLFEVGASISIVFVDSGFWQIFAWEQGTPVQINAFAIDAVTTTPKWMNIVPGTPLSVSVIPIYAIMSLSIEQIFFAIDQPPGSGETVTATLQLFDGVIWNDLCSAVASDASQVGYFNGTNTSPTLANGFLAAVKIVCSAGAAACIPIALVIFGRNIDVHVLGVH